MSAWQSRPLDPVYPVIFIDAVNVKIRDGQVANRPIYVALAVTCEGTRDILGLWAGGTWNFGVDLAGVSGGGADTGVLETDLRKLIHDLALAAEEENVGLAILIDEAQDLDQAELVALCAIAHAAAQDDWRVLFAFAGLPSLPRVLAEAKSYAERFSYEKIEELRGPVASEALTKPAAEDGVEWDNSAVALIVNESAGYPYFLQQFGQDTWNAATGMSITYEDARVGAANGRAALDSGFFRARWDRATRAEQNYLRAMAEDSDKGSSSGK